MKISLKTITRRNIISFFVFFLNFRLSAYDLIIVSGFSLLNNILLFEKIGLAEFNTYSLFLSYIIVFNSLNLGFTLKIPVWIINSENHKNVFIAFISQILVSIFLFSFILFVKYFVPWIDIPGFSICFQIFLFVLSLQIDEIFHVNSRLDGLELMSILTNLLSKLGMLVIIITSDATDAKFYFKWISIYLFIVSVFKLLLFLRHYFNFSFLLGIRKSVTDLVFQSKSTWFSGLSNGIFNGIGRVYLAKLTPIGILGLYTICSQIFSIVQTLLTLHFQHILKPEVSKFSVRKNVFHQKILYLFAALFFLFGFVYSLISLIGINKYVYGIGELSVISFFIVFTVITPIFIVQEFVLIQYYGNLNNVLNYNIKLAIIGILLMTLVYFFTPWKVLILFLMSTIVFLSAVNVSREFKKLKDII